ncbi:hypothetical protein F4778DRAFT_786377 [Xylariomycetidae sp. FL2044]|nr:hypothetical protein F4778DRAFT_786377 [Xylariomycetidae sp. FL2044]
MIVLTIRGRTPQRPLMLRPPVQPNPPPASLRLRDDDPPAPHSSTSSAACDQCRFRKVRCDRQQPECSTCRKAGIACNQTSNFKRVNHTKQLQVFFKVNFRASLGFNPC